MLLLDNLSAVPLHGLIFIFREIDKTVQAERAAEERRVIANLAELHRMLDDGRVSPAEFDAMETALLDWFEQERGEAPENDHGPGSH